MKTTETNDLEKTVEKCMWQVFGNKTFARELFPIKEGQGDGDICTYDPEENKKCIG